jgi:signal peptidase
MDNNIKAPKEKKVKESKPKEKASVGSKVSFIIGIVLCIILVPVLIVNCVLIVKGFGNDKKPPDIFGVVPLTVASPSMYPLFDEGDMIFVQKVDDPTTIKEGDVICFLDPAQKGEVILTHRVVKKYKDEDGKWCVRTAGDFNMAVEEAKTKEDKSSFSEKKDDNKSGYSYWYTDNEDLYDSTPVCLDDETIIGVYNYVTVPHVGDVSNFMAQPYGWAICIGVPVIAFVLFEVISRRKNDKSKKKDMDALLAELEALKAEKEAANKPASDEPVAENTDTEVADATETADPPSEE